MSHLPMTSYILGKCLLHQEWISISFLTLAVHSLSLSHLSNLPCGSLGHSFQRWARQHPSFIINNKTVFSMFYDHARLYNFILIRPGGVIIKSGGSWINFFLSLSPLFKFYHPRPNKEDLRGAGVAYSRWEQGELLILENIAEVIHSKPTCSSSLGIHWA